MTWFDWTSAAPEEVGFDGGKLAAARERVMAAGARAFLVTRRDQVVCESYAPDWNAAKPHFTASLAKALVGGTSLLLALGDGRLGVDDRAADYVPQWREDPLRSQLTIRQLATHTSGISDAEHDQDPGDPQRGWMASFWNRDPDPFTVARDRAPMHFLPGTAYEYSNPGMAMLAYCVTAALRGAPQQDIRTLLNERVYHPIGLREGEWSIGYGRSYQVEGMSLWANWGGGSFTARAVARLARLMLRGGDWQGTQLLDRGWVAQALRHAGTPSASREADPLNPRCGLAWYTNEDGAWPALPRDAFAGAGAQHQVLVAVPSLDLIVVRMGQRIPSGSPDHFWTPAYENVLAPVIDAITA